MQRRPLGQIVVLNGPPRSGKSSIVSVIQDTFEGVWMNLGLDVFARQVTPKRYQPGMGLRPGEEDHVVYPLQTALYAAFYGSIAAHSRAGLNVVADVGHHRREILVDCARRLERLPVLFVGVHCPIEVIMQRRNASPAGHYATGSLEDPPLPVRRWQTEAHVPGIYDLEVDTSVLSPAECAEEIRRRLNDGPGTAFNRLQPC